MAYNPEESHLYFKTLASQMTVGITEVFSTFQVLSYNIIVSEYS